VAAFGPRRLPLEGLGGRPEPSQRLGDAIIDEAERWLACGPVVVAAIAGARLSLVEAVFAMNGSDGVATTAEDVALALSYFGTG
jgi:hypothetical protein